MSCFPVWRKLSVSGSCLLSRCLQSIKVKIESLLVDLRSHPRLQPRAVGDDWKTEMVDTSCRNELPLSGVWGGFQSRADAHLLWREPVGGLGIWPGCFQGASLVRCFMSYWEETPRQTQTHWRDCFSGKAGRGGEAEECLLRLLHPQPDADYKSSRWWSDAWSYDYWTKSFWSWLLPWSRSPVGIHARRLNASIGGGERVTSRHFTNEVTLSFSF